MLITLISDTHFSEPYSFSTIREDGLNSRLLDQLTVFDLVPKDTDVLIHLGDMFHSKFRISHTLYNEVYSRFCESSGYVRILVTGNHDYYEHKRKQSLYPFGKICYLVNRNYRFFDIGKGGEFVYLSLDGNTYNSSLHSTRIHCIPYPATMKEFFNNIEIAESNIIPSMINVLVTHIGIEGAEIGASCHVIRGDIYLNDLRPDKFDFVFLGHYHKHQQLHKNVWYVGSPIQHNFGERDEKKGIMTLENDKVKFIENTLAPKFHVFEVNNEKELAKLPLNNKDFYRITLNGKFIKSMLDTVAKGKKVIYEGGSTVERATRLEERDSTEDILKDYINLVHSSVDSFKCNRDTLLRLGEEYINE